MKTKNLLLLLVTLFIFSGCGDDDDDATGGAANVNCANFTTELSDEIQALTTAGTTYSSDPSSENCNAYLSALDAYFAAVEPFIEQCGSDSDFAQFQSGIDAFRATRDQIQAACGG
ncbi:MAG: hypothetical protein HRT61_07215 [Ekhidna sp.]|nr:hypothetical protein [Ekhidna sp.]